MIHYRLDASSASPEAQVLAEGLSSKLTVGEWEEALQQFTQYHDYQALLAWAVNLPLTVTSDCQQCLNDMRCWVLSPDEELRWRIFTKAQTIGFSSVIGAIGLSLFWSQGSMTAAELEPVYPQPELAGLMLLNALKLACVEITVDGDPLQGAYALLSHWFTRLMEVR